MLNNFLKQKKSFSRSKCLLTFIFCNHAQTRNSKSSFKAQHSKIFTLVELLVVIAILAVLVSLLQPALRKTIYKSKKIVCLNKLKQQVAGLLIYADDNYDFYPHAETGLRNWASCDLTLRNLRGVGTHEVRKGIRPYWGWDGVSTDNQWGVLYPATTDIEKCQLRPDPEDNEGHYAYYFSMNTTPGMRRVGEYLRYDTNDTRLISLLVSDIVMDRRHRAANHNELNPVFTASNSWTHKNAWTTSPIRPPVTGNFGGQDGSVAEYELPPAPANQWVGMEGFQGFGWQTWIPNDFVIEE